MFQFAAWVSAAAVLKPHEGEIAIPGDMWATRGAYLFFSIVGFILAIVLLLLNIFNVVSLGFLNRLPWNLIVNQKKKIYKYNFEFKFFQNKYLDFGN